MVCSLNGKNPLISFPRQLATVEAVTATTGGVVQTISEDYTALYELQMEQWTAHVSAVPTTIVNGAMELWYIHRTESRQNTLLRSVNFAELAVQDVVCIIPFRWKIDDIVRILYSNLDDLNVGTQFLGIELIP